MISRCSKIFVIWQRPDGTIYHKFVSGFYTNYFIGYVNSYGHEVIYIINSDLYYKFRRPPFKARLKRNLIKYIDKM